MAAISFYRIDSLEASRLLFQRLASYGGMRAPRQSSGLPVLPPNGVRSTPRGAYSALALGAGSSEPWALYLSGWIFEGHDRLDSAAARYRRLLNDHPQSDLTLDAQLRLGVIEARRGHYESSLNLLNSLTRTPIGSARSSSSIWVKPTLPWGDRKRLCAVSPNTSAPFREARGCGRRATARAGHSCSLGVTIRRLRTSVRSREAPTRWLRSLPTRSVRSRSCVAIPRRPSTHSSHFSISSPTNRSATTPTTDSGQSVSRQQYDSARHYFLFAARQFPESELRPSHTTCWQSPTWRLATGTMPNTISSERFAWGQRAIWHRGRSIASARCLQARALPQRRRASARDSPTGPRGGRSATPPSGSPKRSSRISSWSEAEHYYAMALARWPESRGGGSRHVSGLAWSRFQQKEFADAAAGFQDFLTRFPKSEHQVEATIRLADAERYLSIATRAIAIYESIGGSEDEGERVEEARFRLAQTFFEIEEYDRAIARLRRFASSATSRGSSLHDVYAYNIAMIYREEGRIPPRW